MDKKILFFLIVVEEGSFSAAARKLLLSQSAISQQISLLEQELSIDLFDRTGYRPVLTDAGRVFYAGCANLRNQYQELENHIKNSNQANLRIGFTGASENEEIPRLINHYKDSHPYVNVSFVKGSFENCVQKIIKNEVHVSFGLESDFKEKEDIVYEKLFKYEICLICSHKHPFAKYDKIDISKLANEKLIVLSQKLGKGMYKDFMVAFKYDGLKQEIIKTVDSFDELVFHVSAGEGVAIVSRNVVRECDVKIVKLINSHHRSNYVIGYHKDNSNPVVKSFVADAIRYFETL